MGHRRGHEISCTNAMPPYGPFLPRANAAACPQLALMAHFCLGPMLRHVRSWHFATFRWAAELGRYQSIADMAQLAAGSTRSRMTRFRTISASDLR